LEVILFARGKSNPDEEAAASVEEEGLGKILHAIWGFFEVDFAGALAVNDDKQLNLERFVI